MVKPVPAPVTPHPECVFGCICVSTCRLQPLPGCEVLQAGPVLTTSDGEDLEGPLGCTPSLSPSGASPVVFCLLGSGEKRRIWGTTGVQQLLSGESLEPLDAVWLSLSQAGPVLWRKVL